MGECLCVALFSLKINTEHTEQLLGSLIFIFLIFNCCPPIMTYVLFLFFFTLNVMNEDEKQQKHFSIYTRLSRLRF